jgi:capsular polysaccharide biosynthesis protein
MKQRVTEVLFKHKFLLVLPFVVILPLTVAAALRPQPDRWQVFARVWVDQYQGLYRDERLGYTPGPAQAQLLNDFVGTRSFARDVLSQTQLAPLLDDPVSEELALQEFWRAVSVFSTSNTFITISVLTESPEISYEIAQALVASFESTLRTRGEVQSKITTELYAQELAKRQQAVDRSRAELAAYVAAHPELMQASGSTLATARDATFARLSAQAEYDQNAYRETLIRYEQGLAMGAAGLQSSAFAFTVVDPPSMPAAPLHESRVTLLKLPVIGFVLAVILSAGAAVALIFTNRSVLGASEVRDQLNIPVLGEIPVLRPRRWFWQRLPRHAVRQILAMPARQVLVSDPAKP